MSTYVSQAFSDQLDMLARMVRTGRKDRWTIHSAARRGETVLLYAGAPISGIVAIGTVRSPKTFAAHPDDYWPAQARAMVTVERLIDPPLPLAEIRRRLPKWGWAKMPLAHVHVPEKHERTLLRLAGATRRRRISPAPTPANPRLRATGAGFGTPEQNRKTEAAAVRFVRRHLESEGWELVKDCQQDGCGYDFEYRRGREKLHAEIKGVRGTKPDFMITAGEVRKARTDPAFRIFVVTRALTRQRTITEITGRQLERRYDLEEVGYFARNRGSHLPERSQ